MSNSDYTLSKIWVARNELVIEKVNSVEDKLKVGRSLLDYFGRLRKYRDDMSEGEIEEVITYENHIQKALVSNLESYFTPSVQTEKLEPVLAKMRDDIELLSEVYKKFRDRKKLIYYSHLITIE